jgi:hypothetical protein
MCDILSRILGRDTSRATLLRLAESLARAKHVVVDRLAKRSKECLICWFCEFVPELLVNLVVPTPAPAPAVTSSNGEKTESKTDSFASFFAELADGQVYEDDWTWTSQGSNDG